MHSRSASRAREEDIMGDEADKLRKLSIRTRETVEGNGVRVGALSVFCTTQAKSVAVSSCATCSRCAALTSKPGGFVECRTAEEREPVPNPVVYRTQRLDTAERAARLSVGEVTKKSALCV